MKNKILKINLLIMCNIFLIIKTDNDEVNYKNNSYYENILNSFDGYEIFKNKDGYITNEDGYIRPYELIKYNKNNEIKDWLNKFSNKYNNFEEINNSTKDFAISANNYNQPKYITSLFRYPKNINIKFLDRANIPFINGFYLELPIINKNEIENDPINFINSIKDNNYFGYLKEIQSIEDFNKLKNYNSFFTNEEVINFLDKKNTNYISNLDSFLKLKNGLNKKKKYLESKDFQSDYLSKLDIINYKINEINKNIQSEYPEYKE